MASSKTDSSPANASRTDSRPPPASATSSSRSRSPSSSANAGASPYKARHHLVFCNTLGRGLDYRDVGEDFRATLKRAGISADGERLSLHSLRHGFASLLISQGLNVVFVSRQLGHANANITLGVYAHLYDRADHAATARHALETSYTATSVK